ncbi:MAG: hypothetical protein A3C36_04335 [Omnitrophica WOR_2 bacterium RIFCSPHIGHO2_02_FULL_52_10]|nr:MAG: hypothetical protein A3C36_04335 [Omnitrophica WOR_2 bacterium RIFCSPHIGHO2_02_FULL_52_10]
MSNAIEFTNVWKKFKKGEKINSLRDAIPNLFKRKDRNLTLEEREFWAVKDVSFNIEKGGVIGIMGPNGAGKSTILKLLSRIIVPNEGSIKIIGRLSALIEVTAGFHSELTGRENVYLNATILGMRKKEIDAKFDDIVEFSGVREFIDTPVKRYSSGMYSRLGFSVAAHMEPDILLVDEVLSVGDIAFQAKCAQKIRELLHSGATIVLVSHQLDMIQSLCKRVILLRRGEVVMDGDVDEVIPHYQNIVNHEIEAEMKGKLGSNAEKVKVDTSSAIEIKNVRMVKSDGAPQENFSVGDALHFIINVTAREEVESPIFKVDIVRSDGVLCCSSFSDKTGLILGNVKGDLTMNFVMDKLLLTPSIYMVKFSVWDKNKIHSYHVRNQDILRIDMDQMEYRGGPVLALEAKWSVS